jgi:hypothetical protein
MARIGDTRGGPIGMAGGSGARAARPKGGPERAACGGAQRRRLDPIQRNSVVHHLFHTKIVRPQPSARSRNVAQDRPPAAKILLEQLLLDTVCPETWHLPGFGGREVTEPFAEYREIGVADPLRQGDVLEAVDVGASIWQRHLFVITADCDFAHDKHQGRVTCIPLLAADEYLSVMQIPKIRERLVKKLLASMRALLSKVGAPNISDQRLREWASEEGPAVIAMTLGLEEVTAQEARSAIEAIRMIDTPAPNLKESINSLVEAQLLGTNPPKRDKALKDVVTPLQQAYARPPGDALFLTSIAPAHDAGYFAYLRHLEQIWEPDISIGPTRREVKYRRISHIQDRFAHALVQRFAMVFMSIGLPKEYEDLRDVHSELLGDIFK